mmetsp:Transcript_35739/g.57017  ORF Transcript_35739/g.57017 Transcript_35739/m.57017 type:complete len:90 (-) Transcript_35739:952-1221(-)
MRCIVRRNRPPNPQMLKQKTAMLTSKCAQTSHHLSTAEMEELGDNGREVFQEKMFVLRIELDVVSKVFVLNENYVGWKHHQFASWIFEL